MPIAGPKGEARPRDQVGPEPLARRARDRDQTPAHPTPRVLPDRALNENEPLAHPKPPPGKRGPDKPAHVPPDSQQPPTHLRTGPVVRVALNFYQATRPLSSEGK